MNLAAIKARVAALAGVKHTPGPFHIDERMTLGAHGKGHPARPASFSVCAGALGTSNRPIAHLAVRANGDNVSEMRANAQLLTAAPEAVADRAELVALVETWREMMQSAADTMFAHHIGNWEEIEAELAKVQP